MVIMESNLSEIPGVDETGWTSDQIITFTGIYNGIQMHNGYTTDEGNSMINNMNNLIASGKLTVQQVNILQDYVRDWMNPDGTHDATPATLPDNLKQKNWIQNMKAAWSDEWSKIKLDLSGTGNIMPNIMPYVWVGLGIGGLFIALYTANTVYKFIPHKTSNPHKKGKRGKKK